MDIALAAPADLDLIAPLRRALWPDSHIDELKQRAQDMVGAAPGLALFIARDVGGAAVGFAEVALRRDYVNGCETTPVAFLEGIHVAPPHRRCGIGRALVHAGREWARTQGLSEFASDALLDNTASHAFHRAAGFAETERVVYFRMDMGPEAA